MDFNERKFFLPDYYAGRTLLEQVEVTLSSIGDRRWAGLIARDKGERASWFQSGDGKRKVKSNNNYILN